MTFYLGIDGGATKTSCLIGDETSVLGRGAAGPSNMTRVDEATARAAFSVAIQQACAEAHISPTQISRATIGLAGAGRPQITQIARRLLAEIIPSPIEVVGDHVIALEAAFGPGPGVIVIAGTGSMAYGRNATGQTARAGGWGFAISDEGSGYWIGRLAVTTALRFADENESAAEPPLLTGIMKFFGVENRDQLVLAANASPSPNFAGLFPTVVALADSGDFLAREVFTSAGRGLAALAKTVIRRLFAGDGQVPVAMSGGVSSASELVRQVFYNSLRSDFPGAQIGGVVVEPVQGALALARRMKS